MTCYWLFKQEQRSVFWQWAGSKKKANGSIYAHRIHQCPVYTLHCKNNSWSKIKNIYILLHPTFRCSFLSVSSVRRICCSTCATNPVNMHLDLLRDVLKCSCWKISKLIVSDLIHCLFCLWIFTVDCTGQDLQSSLSKSGQNDLIDCGQHTRH